MASYTYWCLLQVLQHLLEEQHLLVVLMVLKVITLSVFRSVACFAGRLVSRYSHSGTVVRMLCKTYVCDRLVCCRILGGISTARAIAQLQLSCVCV